MFHLYARPGAGNVAVEAILELAGAEYRVETVERDADGKFPASFFKINPLGQVPTLVLPGGAVMTESAAICLYLADHFQAAGLAPAPGDPQRGAYLRWMVFLAANVYMTDLRVFYSERYTTDAGGAEAVKASAVTRMAEEWKVLAEALGDKPYFLGSKLSALDVYAAMLADWSPDLADFWKRHPNVKAMRDRVVAVPAVAKVWARNGM